MPQNNIEKARALLISAYYLLVNDGVWKKTPEERANMTMACQDANAIPRVKNAGKIIKKDGEDVQVMHNGLLVKEGGYQGGWQSKTIEHLKGIHEPQEEKVFHEVLKKLPENAVIMELGSWWAYYSLWLLKEKKLSRAICGEPDPDNLLLAKANAKLNNIDNKRVSYYESAAGSSDGKKISFKTENGTNVQVPIRTVDSLVSEEKVESVDILHLDIQGAELEALKGAVNTIRKKKLRFVFISTHHYAISEDPLLHQKCINFIKKNGGAIVAEHGILESCSGDGLIVASFFSQDKDFKVQVSRINPSGALFREYEYDVDALWNAHNTLIEYIKLTEIENDRHIEQLRHEIKWKSEHIDYLEKTLDTLRPLKKHIKLSVSQRLESLKNKVKN